MSVVGTFVYVCFSDIEPYNTPNVLLLQNRAIATSHLGYIYNISSIQIHSKVGQCKLYLQFVCSVLKVISHLYADFFQ